MNEPLSFLKVFPDGPDNKESACSARDQVQSLGWEDPLEKEMATHSRGAWPATAHGVAKSWTQLRD